jgi:membrane protease YdiL (CAAX protease family)
MNQHRGHEPTAWRREALLALVCVAGGLLFFVSLDRLWPLADIDLVVESRQLQADARRFLESRGFAVDGFASASRLVVDAEALEYLERSFGRQRTQEWIVSGAPIHRYRVYLKKRGDPRSFTVALHPAVGVIGWTRKLEDDDSGASLTQEQARQLAYQALVEVLGLDPGELEERAASTNDLPARRDHRFRFERLLSDEPELRERLRVDVAGDRVGGVVRTWLVPPAAQRESRSDEAPGRALETIGFALLGLGVFVAFVVFLRALRDGRVELGSAIVWPVAAFACFLGTYVLSQADLFAAWEPLWPRWVSGLQYVVYRGLQDSVLLLVLLALFAAGYALDRRHGWTRGATLVTLGRGRVLDRGVARASFHGFLVGLLCGGVISAAVILLQRFVGAETGLQPRGFFFYPLNSVSPAATSLLFFLGVALGEELGYRFFGGTWLLGLTRRRWVAIVLPAVIYGLTHTRMDFLPTATPFWSRALVLTLVGCVWGWAFLRYDALTVVLSHFTADLFIFNWPRLASGEPRAVLLSVFVCCVPLAPALLWGAWQLMPQRRGSRE